MSSPFRWILHPGGNLQPAWYHASKAEECAVLARYWHKHGLPPARLQKVIGWKLSIATGAVLDIGIMLALNLYWFSTGITPTSVVS